MTKVNRRTAVFTTQRSLKLATITTLAACLPTSSQSTYSVILAAGISLVPCADAFVLMHGRIAGGNHLRTWRRRAGEESYSDEEDGMQVPRSRKKVQLESYGFEGRSQPRSQGKQRYVDELSKSELFSRLTEKGSTHHDDVVIRSSRGGRQLSVPQAERYRSSDWAHILWATPNSIVLRRIWNPLLVNVIFAAAVAVAQQVLGTPTRIFYEMHALMGSALGLLLVFRTNAAYQRFWEGRTIWESLLGHTRDLARMCMLYRRELGRERVKRVANLVCTFPFVLSEHLGARVTDNYSHLVTREDLLLLNRIGNRPLGLANTMGMEIKAIPDKTEGDQILFSSRERLAMLSLVDKIAKSVGSCERLVQTPIPLNYARHTSRFLSLWCLTLAPALVGQLGFLVVPVTGVVTWGLYGIQEIGLMIEEPFRRALRLDIVTRTIYADVQETTYMPEWAKRSMLEKSQANEAKKAADLRLAMVLSGNSTRVTGSFNGDAPPTSDGDEAAFSNEDDSTDPGEDGLENASTNAASTANSKD